MKHKIEGVKPEKVVNDIDINRIKEQFGVDLQHEIKGNDGFTSVLYIKNLDELYDQDVDEVERIFKIVGNAKPEYSDDDISNLMDESGSDDDNLDDLLEDLGDDDLDEKDLDFLEDDDDDDATLPTKKDLDELITRHMENDQSCVLNEILKRYSNSIHNQIIDIIREICNEHEWELDKEMIFPPL
jgi:hypothetical protein